MTKGRYMGATYCVLFVIFVFATTVSSDDTTPIPADASQVGKWFQTNVKPLASRKGTLDPALEAAEANPKTITVSKDGKGDFKTLTDAIKSIPLENKQRVIVKIGPGVYTEKLQIERGKHFITFLGDPNDKPTLAFNGQNKQYGTLASASVAVESDYFMAFNIIFKNTAPKPEDDAQGGQAVALRVSGDKAAFYNCTMLGYQDTLCDDRGQHFFKNCYIEGTVDFIFGRGKSLYMQTHLHVVENGGYITAQSENNETRDHGYSFVQCKITGIGSETYLGRAWRNMPQVVFAYTEMSNVVNPLGWSNNNHPERDRTVFFAEHKNSGPGSNLAGRVKFAKKLTDLEIKPYISLGHIQGSTWLLPPPL